MATFIRPATLSFPHVEGTGYVHWMSKGERANRISFSAFNQEGHRGVGAYVQERVTPGL